MYHQLTQRIGTMLAMPHVALVTRGNTAIASALSICNSSDVILYQEEGGWLYYKQYALRHHIQAIPVSCHYGVIDLVHLEELLRVHQPKVFIYHQLGAYCAPQPTKEIYALTRQYGCICVMDVCGSFGTEFCKPHYADIVVASFREWKPVNAGCGGCIATHTADLYTACTITPLQDTACLEKINHALDQFPHRLAYLASLRQEIIHDLKKQGFSPLYPHQGFVVIVPVTTSSEKQTIINYCQSKKVEWTNCPRDIRILQQAVSIEVKRK